MKKLEEKGYQSKMLSGIRLSYDDIEYLIKTMDDEFKNIEILDNEYIYESLDELIEKKGTRPKKLKIDGMRKNNFYENINIDFDEINVFICTYDRNITYLKLVEYLKNKIPWQYKVFSPWIWVTTLLIYNILAEFILTTIKFELNIFLLSLIMLSITHRNFDLGIHLVREHQATFIKRNKDQIILLVLGSILGIISTLLVQATL